jgi:hypothetical protein
MDEFTPSFNIPGLPSKRFETPRNFQQQPDPYQNYAYNYNNYQYQDPSKTSMDQSPINQNFELNRSRQKISSQLERASQN